MAVEVAIEVAELRGAGEIVDAGARRCVARIEASRSRRNGRAHAAKCARRSSSSAARVRRVRQPASAKKSSQYECIGFAE